MISPIPRIRHRPLNRRLARLALRRLAGLLPRRGPLPPPLTGPYAASARHVLGGTPKGRLIVDRIQQRRHLPTPPARRAPRAARRSSADSSAATAG